MNRFAPIALAFALSLVVGCQKEEVKTEPAAPSLTANTQAVNAPAANAPAANAPAPKLQPQAQAAAAVQGQTKVTAAPVGALPVRLRAEDGREIRGDGTTTVMKAEDGRKITNNGDGTMVLDDPSRPGAKIVVPVPH